MHKRGLSALLATVLLVGFTIALGTVFITWGNTFMINLQQSTEKTALKTTTCSADIPINIRNACLDGNKIKILVENQGRLNATRLNIRVIGENGAYTNLTSSGINAFGINTVTAVLDPNLIGALKRVEVFPVIDFQGEEVSCVNVYDSEDFITGCPDPGLVAYYDFNDNTNDLSGNNNDGVNNGAVFVSGVSGKALDFDGSDYVVVSDSPSLGVSNDFTIEAWIRPTAIGNTHAVLSKDDVGADTYGAYILYAPTAAGQVMYKTNNRGAVVVGGSIYTKWQNIAITFDDDIVSVTIPKMLIYIDGNLITGGNPLAPQILATSLLIGRDGLGSFFNGRIDEVKIYNYTKTY